MTQRSRLICWFPRGRALEELGLPLATTGIRGGELEAVAFCEDAERVAKPQTSPAAFDPPATTLLVRA